MELYYLLLAHCHSLWYSTIFLCLPFLYLWNSNTFYWLHAYTYGTLIPSTGSLPIPMVLYYLLLAPCLSLWNSTTFYWPTAYTYGILLSSNGPCISPWYFTIFYWPNDYTMILFCLQLAPFLSLWYSTIFYCPTAYTQGILLSYNGSCLSP